MEDCIMNKPARPDVLKRVMNEKEDPVTEDYIREHYGIPSNFTGEALHKEAARLQEIQNQEWNAAKKKGTN